MERLETKQVKGHTYYYYSRWARIDGRCRRVWQRYLGKLEDLVQAVEGGPRPHSAEVFQYGLTEALWKECAQIETVGIVDQHIRKRNQGLSTGQYLAIAAINRAIAPRSKRSMWEWFSQTTLLRHLPAASPATLTSQRFWDHMDRIDAKTATQLWQEVLRGVVQREHIDLSSVSYDGTNFYTFIDTFNVRCQVAQRGKNKQGRNNLRQVSYALFCCADGHLPLFYDVYEGHRNDAKQFPVLLRRFHEFFARLGRDGQQPETTLVFDKGNNSVDNFLLLDQLNYKFVGSVKLGQHRDLADVSNHDGRFRSCASVDLEGTKAFRVLRTVAGKERVLVVTYNQNLFDSQLKTVHKDVARALEKLAVLRGRLEDRAAGLVKGGRAPTVAAVERKCQTILSRQYLKRIVHTQVRLGEDQRCRLEYQMDATALQTVCDTNLGKTILISNRSEWDDERIIRAYRSQFIIEGVFKETKDRDTGIWWRMHHWTDSKIHVHALYCTIALLLRALMLRRAVQAGLPLSMPRLLSELRRVREVVTIYPRKRSNSTTSQTVLSKTSELQQQLLSLLGIGSKNVELG